MKKNKRAQDFSARSERGFDKRSSSNRERTAIVILLIAFLFFLLGLIAFAYASGFSFFDRNGFNPSFGNRRGTGLQTGQQNGTNRGPGGNGSTNGNGSGTNQNGDENGSGATDLNVNVQNDAIGELDAGIRDGQLHIDPNLNPNSQGGTGSEAHVNEDKVLDTDSLLN